jgi:hypothetical protein
MDYYFTPLSLFITIVSTLTLLVLVDIIRNALNDIRNK